MRFAAALLLLAISIAPREAEADNPAGASGSKASFKIAISTGQAVITAGAQLRVNVSLTNISDHEITVEQSSEQGRNYEFDVRSRLGASAKSTKHYRAVHGDEDTTSSEHPYILADKAALVRLSPGDTTKSVVVLSDLFDLNEPGEYTIRVQRRDNMAVVKSNAITVTVTR